jgi:hypothetical protein
MEWLKIGQRDGHGTYDAVGKAFNEEEACIKMASVCSLMRQRRPPR